MSAFGTKRTSQQRFLSLLLGAKRTSFGLRQMSAFDPKRTFQPNHLRSAGLTRYHALFRALGEAMRHSPARRGDFVSVRDFSAAKTTRGAVQLRQPRKRT